jgi:hypothetical protein
MKILTFLYNIILGLGLGTLTTMILNILYKQLYNDHPPFIWGILAASGAYSITFHLYYKMSLKP